MLRLAVVALVVATVLTGCGTRAAGPDETGGQVAADRERISLEITSTTSSGASFDATSLSGKPVVFWFWAPWCATCQAQAPGVRRLAETYADKVAVVGVGSLDERAAVQAFAEDVPGVTHLVDPDGAVWRHFGVKAQSTYLVLDPDGGKVASGYLEDEELADMVAELAG